MTFPTIGIIYKRDAHPSAKRLADLTTPDIVEKTLCDEQVSLEEALVREWAQDAHFMLYRVDGDEQGDEFAFTRVAKRAPFRAQLERAGGRIRVVILAFDYDLPKKDGRKQEWTEESLGGFVQELAGAPVPEPSAFYDTLHGARMVYILSEEVDPDTAEALAWGMIERFARAGITLDPACADWTRLFRLPNTIREDSGKSYEPNYLGYDGPKLDVASAPRSTNPLKGQTYAEVDPYSGDMPTPEEVHELLTVTTGTKVKDSPLVKTAKTYLEGRESGAVVAGTRPLAVGEEGWNNQVTKIVGQTVGMLARQDGVTAEGIYALLHSAIAQLQAREDRGAKQANWYELTWNLICRMWSNEEAQIIAEREALETKQAEGEETRAAILETLREEGKEPVPEDPVEAAKWILQRMIASDGRRHFVMRKDSSYNIEPVPDSLLVPQIRDLGMEGSIPTTEIRGKQLVQRSAQAILNECSTPISTLVCSSTIRASFIDGPAGSRVLHIPVHRLNSKLQPGGAFDENVDRWLRALGGEKYEHLMEWLSYALQVDRPICALNLYGAPGSGKGMLAEGLSECFEGETRNDGSALGKFNGGLLKSPIVNCDEGVPNITSDESLSIDQAFRSMVTGGKVGIRMMHRDKFTAHIYPRILFTSNDRDILRSIVGHRDLTADDIAAIEKRLLNIHVGDAASTLLTSKGNYAYTRGWVAGDAPSRYILANHLYHLFCTRRPPQVGTGRLLVEGDAHSALVADMRLRSKGALSVLRALTYMIESPAAGRKGIHINADRIWVTPMGVLEYHENALNQSAKVDLTLPTIGRILRQFAIDNPDERKSPVMVPPGLTHEHRARWVELDIVRLYEDGMKQTLSVGRLEKMILTRHNGRAIIERVAAAGDPQ